MNKLAHSTLVALVLVSLPTLAQAHHTPSHRARPAPRFVGSYEAAMQLPVNYNFGGTDGAQQGGLDPGQVAAPLTGALPRFVRCVAREQARGGAFDRVNLRVVVGSGGTALGVSVDHESAAFRTCVTGVVRGLRWASFEGPRVGFSWAFTVE